MTKKTTKNELLAELDLKIESVSPDLASSGETAPASVADVEERHRTLTGWREQIEAADADDPVIEEIAAKLDS